MRITKIDRLQSEPAVLEFMQELVGSEAEATELALVMSQTELALKAAEAEHRKGMN